MNQLVRREVAIVSPHAGTTRDVIEVQLDLDGYPVTVIDTAGIRETNDPVEQEGVRRARARALEADLVLWLSDGPSARRSHEEATPVWMIRNKIDLDVRGSGPADSGRPLADAPKADYAISASKGDGIQQLVAGRLLGRVDVEDVLDVIFREFCIGK
jgi:tRNA modification GTPase